MSLSNITISGTLKEDPKKRFTPTNVAVTNLLLEVAFMGRGQRPGETQLVRQLVRVNAWRDLADYSESRFKSGDKLLVTGRALINSYTTPEGKRKRELEIDASSIVLLQDLIQVELPEKVQEKSTEKPSIKKKESFSTTNEFELEPISDLSEAISSQEEIPF